MSEYVAFRDGGKTNEEGLHKGQDRFLEGDVPTIHDTNSFKIVQRGAGANMSVDVSIGDGLFDKGDYSFWAWTDAVVNKTVTASDPTNPRIDVVIAYVDLSVVSSASNNNPGALKFAVVAGTPAGSPTTPDSTARQAGAGAGNPYISLASIAVAASATNIVNANITDLRVPISFKGKLYGGSSNTSGHTIPNTADDTVALLAAAQALTNKTITGTTNAVRGGGVNSSLVDSAGVQENIERRIDESMFDFVASGCVWSGDSYGATRAASMTAGVVYINGQRVAVTAVTARSFTASRDTYIDVGADGVVDYSEVTNNNTSPALAEDHIRLGIIVTDATDIQDVGSVNQGQEDKVLPIVSSVPLSVTDTVGNLICPRDPRRLLLGYKQRTTAATVASVTPTQIAELSVPIIIPTGRKIKIIISGRDLYSTTADAAGIVGVYDGAVGGTLVGSTFGFQGGGGGASPLSRTISLTPTSSSKTYNVALSGSSGTGTVDAASTDPFSIRIELA